MKRTKNYTLLVLPLLLSACTLSDENGGADIRLNAPILADQSWQAQKSGGGNDRVCTVAAGGLDVTQRGYANHVYAQVGFATDLAPGEFYRVIIGPHVYETYDNYFNAADSRAIIADFNGGAQKAYTEYHKLVIPGWHGREWQSRNNTLDLDGFAQQYRACSSYVQGKGR